MGEEKVVEAKPAVPMILRLRIERYRGLESFNWLPDPHVNVIIGGGDNGKTTILDAVGLLLSPANSVVISDADYWKRAPEGEFIIEAVLKLPPDTGINEQKKPSWPWEWDGNKPVVPNPDDEETDRKEEVYVVRVRGTPDCDLAYEICQPNGEFDHFSVSVRRKIGLVKLGGDDRNDRDLRLIQGSALDRLLSDKSLRAKLAKEIGEKNVEEKLGDSSKKKLSDLDTQFGKQALPINLGLGLVGGQGFSLNALIGLTAEKHDVRLPLSSWGSGTRRLAALEIASSNQNEQPITIVDEVERGLEPYRQRVLVKELMAAPTQAFITTHSVAAIKAATSASIWYLSGERKIGKLADATSPHMMKDPEAFLSRIAIVAEGATEVGFVKFLILKAVSSTPLEYGIWVTDGGGNDPTLQLLESLAKSGLKFSGFADDEGRAPERWATLKTALGGLLLRWPKGCLEENVIEHVADNDLEKFIADPDGDSGERLRTLALRLKIEEKSYAAILAAAGSPENVRKLIIAAATGSVPAGTPEDQKKALKSHGKTWFKTVGGGFELGSKMLAFGIWPTLEGQLLPFVNAIRQSVDLPVIAELPDE
ncbi:ATP-binding protein [Phyllobacterium salinisoli]|uniref:ATP-binding protein n=1 Tax=Phyllobacterium salinisoli TaxID=1899321 RepID=A0A368KB14_9HYPH|nr:AAA family ATPase [Phyllobacterium salinisoli]RCS25775.1 ATP-binding protein [Phyllobacterium salinisoli]